MKDKQTTSGSDRKLHLVKRGSFVAEIRAEDDQYRFVIRDENREKPSIHGAKKSLKESEHEVLTMLDQLCPLERAA